MPRLCRDGSRPPRGVGLVELIVALSLAGLLTVGALHGLARLRDAWGVASARSAVAALVREARARAVARGGAHLRISARTGVTVLEAGSVALRTLDVTTEFGVALDLGGPDEVALVFDPAGVGRMAARTVGLTRGAETRRLVISGYGRVR